MDGRSIQSARELHDHQKHQKTLKSLLQKIIEEEFRLKYDIQNHVPAVIDHTNMSFESRLEMFIGRSQQVHDFKIFILTLSQLYGNFL
jgi:cytidylate kinase